MWREAKPGPSCRAGGFIEPAVSGNTSPWVPPGGQPCSVLPVIVRETTSSEWVRGDGLGRSRVEGVGYRSWDLFEFCPGAKGAKRKERVILTGNWEAFLKGAGIELGLTGSLRFPEWERMGKAFQTETRKH